MNNLEWQQIGVESDNIERMAHSDNDLYVEYKNNTGYKYLNVPYEIFQRILNRECISKSKGKPSYGSTLDKLVKKAGYHYEQYK